MDSNIINICGIIITSTIGIIAITIAWKQYKKRDIPTDTQHIIKMMDVFKRWINSYKSGFKRNRQEIEDVIVLERITITKINKDGSAEEEDTFHIINLTDDPQDGFLREWYTDQEFLPSFKVFDDEGPLPDPIPVFDTKQYKTIKINFRHPIKSDEEYKFTIIAKHPCPFLKIYEKEWYETTIKNLTARLERRIYLPIFSQLSFVRLLERGPDGTFRLVKTNIKTEKEGDRPVIFWGIDFPVIGRVYRLEFAAQSEK